MRLRAPVVGDAPAVQAVLEARDRVDLGVADCTLGDLLGGSRASDFELGSDARVAEDENGSIVAYAVVQRSASMVTVAPDHEGKGVGSELLEWVQARERQLRRDCHRQWLYQRVGMTARFRADVLERPLSASAGGGGGDG